MEDLTDDVRGKKISRVKKNLNSVAASLMTKELLDEVDPNGEVLSWFREMKQLIEA